MIDSQTRCTPAFSIRPGSHLNNADHVAIEFGPRDGPSAACPTPFKSGILANGVFTPLVTLSLIGGSTGINDADQLALVFSDGGRAFLQLWDGTSVVNLGAGGGLSLNSLGHALYLSGVGPSATTRRC